MKKLLLLTTVLFIGAMSLQAQKLIPERVNPHYGPYHIGTEANATLVFENTDSKPVLINEYVCQTKNGKGGGIKVEPGKKWALKFTIDTKDIGVGKRAIECRIMSNAINFGEEEIESGFPIFIDIINPPTRPN